MSDAPITISFDPGAARSQAERQRLADWLRNLADHLEADRLVTQPKAVVVVLLGDDGDEVARPPGGTRSDLLGAGCAITAKLAGRLEQPKEMA